jgi:hypothetical protein
MVVQEFVQQCAEGRCLGRGEWRQQATARSLRGGAQCLQQAEALRREGEHPPAAVSLVPDTTQQVARLQQPDHHTRRGPIQAEQLRQPNLIQAGTFMQRHQDPVLGRGHLEDAAFLGEDGQGDLVRPSQLEARAPVESRQRLGQRRVRGSAP